MTDTLLPRYGDPIPGPGQPGPPIDNWPPGYLDPIPEPQGIAREIARANAIRDQALAMLRDWRRWATAHRANAWVEYHDEHGWPDDPDYEARERLAARRQA